MKFIFFHCVLLAAITARAEMVIGKYDMASVRDASTLETRVVEDWHPWGNDTNIRQKLIEITICDWWPGQKVRLPVTLLAPASGGPCKNVIVANTALALKATSPSGALLRLLKEHRVGLIFIGMNSIDAMEPAGKLDVGMKEQLLKTKDMRFTPAWIWGLSDMRALTAAMAEKDVFQPEKALATGGSKRGVATAAAGIADDRFTAIMPWAAPIIESPGGPYVEGMMPADIVAANDQFLIDLSAGKIANAPATGHDVLVARDRVRAFERITVKEARDAGWNDEEMKTACSAAWEVCRTTNYLPALQKRGLEIFYNEGTNDNVGPGLLELGRRFPDLLINVVPGAQHGAAKEAGFKKQIGSLPEIDENLFAFAEHHFFNARPMIATPRIATQWDANAKSLHVTVTFPDHAEPQKNEAWWSVDRHADYTFAMEYDAWESMPLRRIGPGIYSAEITLPARPRTVDLVGVYQQTDNGSTLTGSSPLVRVECR